MCYSASEAPSHESEQRRAQRGDGLASVRYFLSSSLPLDRQDDLRQVLDSNGATPAATLKDATHIITNSHRFEGSGEVDAGVHVVTVRVACF